MIDAFEADALAEQVFGSVMFKAFRDYKRYEWRSFQAHVTDWERARYLKHFRGGCAGSPHRLGGWREFMEIHEIRRAGLLDLAACGKVDRPVPLLHGVTTRGDPYGIDEVRALLSHFPEHRFAVAMQHADAHWAVSRGGDGCHWPRRWPAWDVASIGICLVRHR